jgi:Ring finger domain
VVVKTIPPKENAGLAGPEEKVVGMCSIYIDDITEGTYLQALPCEHIFHDTCSTATQGNDTSGCPIW